MEKQDERFAFVTHNSKDFSEPHGNSRKPHPDLSSLFGAARSTYWGSLVRSEVVHDDDVSGLEFRDEDLIDIGLKR